MKKNIDGTVYEKEIITFLEKKYDESFIIRNLYQEFEGNSGMTVRALCSKKGDTDQFSVYCYFDSSIATDRIIVDGNEHSIVDSYAEVLFQKNLCGEIDNIDNENNYIVECNVDFNAEQPSKTDIASGAMFCLQKQELDPYVKFYIVAGYNAKTDEIQVQIEKVMNEYRPSTGYIYIAYVDQFNASDVARVYVEEQNDFGNYLTNTNFAERVEFVLYKSETGLQEKQIIRE